MRFLFLFIVLISAGTLFAQTPGPLDTTMSVKRLSYVINSPVSWTIDSSKTFGMDLLLVSPKSDSLDNFSENMNIFTQDLHNLGYTLEKMGRESEAQIMKMVTDVQVIESRLDTLGIQPRYVLHYKGKQGQFLLTTIQHYYLKNDTGYALTMTIKQGEESAYMDKAKKIFDSFSFLD